MSTFFEEPSEELLDIAGAISTPINHNKQYNPQTQKFTANRVLAV